MLGGVGLLWFGLPVQAKQILLEALPILWYVHTPVYFLVNLPVPTWQELLWATVYVGSGTIFSFFFLRWCFSSGLSFCLYLVVTALLLVLWTATMVVVWGVTTALAVTLYEWRILGSAELYNLVAGPGADKGLRALWGFVLLLPWAVGVVGILIRFSFALGEDTLPAGIIHQRGRKLLSFRDAQKKASQLIREGEQIIRWGWLTLPSRIAMTHFAVIGSTGSGKTILIRILMQSVLPDIGKGKDTRALVYDAKQDSMSMLSGIAPHAEILLLNPFDKRGVAWDMAKDITSPTTAQQVATILIPEAKNLSQPFFSDAARHLLSGVLISLIRNKPGKWTFRDVVLIMAEQERLKSALEVCPATSSISKQYLHDGQTAKNVMSTVATKMQKYHFVAAAWERAERSISLREWLSSESILVLGNDEATRTALDAINQVIFKRLSELILAQNESESRRTWIFLDELRQAGNLQGLSSLLTKGRSKGTCVVLGYQDIEGLREVYGTQLANEIAGQCANKAILRCDSADTARWASALFGQSEVIEVSRGSSRNSENKTTHSSNERFKKREVVLPSEIMGLKPTSPEYGMEGFFITPHIGSYYAHLDGEYIGEELIAGDHNIENIVPRSEEDQYLSEWDNPDEIKPIALEITESQDPPVCSADSQSLDLFNVKRSKVENM